MPCDGGSFRALALMRHMSITSNFYLRILFPALFGLLLLLPPVSHARINTLNVQETIGSARELIQNNKLEQAEKSLKKAAQRNKSNPEVRYLLGAVYEKKGQYRKAIRAFRYAIHLQPQYLDAVKGWARVELAQGHEEASLAPFANVILLEPGNLEASYQTARIQYKIHGIHGGEARKALEQVLEIDPDHRPTLKMLAEYYTRLADTSPRYKAKEYMRMSKKYSNHLAILGNTGSISGIDNESRQTIDQNTPDIAGGKQPVSEKTETRKGSRPEPGGTRSLSKVRNTQNTRPTLGKSGDRTKSIHERDYVETAKRFIQQKKYARAEKNIRKAIKKDNKNPEARYLLGVVEEHEENYSKAVRSYRYAILLDSKYLEAYKAWARVEIEQRDEKDAIGPLGKIASLEPDNVETYYQLGRLYNKYSSKGSNKTQRYLEKALKLDPNHQPSLEELAAYYNSIGYRSRARGYEDRLAALDGGRNSAIARGTSTRSFNHSRGVRSTSNRSYTSSRKYGKKYLDEPVYAPYGGPKMTIAVLTFENKTRGRGSQEIGEGLTEMLTTELFKTGRFILVERSAIKEIVNEQALGQTGLVRQGSSAKVGQLAGAQFLVKGAVTEFKYRAGGGGGALAFQGVSLGMKSNSAKVGIDIRIIDSSTGQIVDSYNARAKAKSSGVKFGFSRQDLQFGAGGFENTPLGQATREAMQKAINFIIDKSRNIPWEGVVIKSKANIAYINRGSNANLNIGDQLVIYNKGENLIDPQTGVNLGGEKTRVGALKLTKVKKKFSKGKIKLDSSESRVRKGDLVQFK